MHIKETLDTNAKRKNGLKQNLKQTTTSSVMENHINTEALLKLFDAVLEKNPEVEKTAQRVNDGLATFVERMRAKKKMPPTSEFRLNIGVNPGYHHDNEVKNPVEIVATLWQQMAERVFQQLGIFVGATVTSAKTVYRIEWGCPPGGEDTVLVCGLRNTEFVENDEAWRTAVTAVTKKVALALNQKTAYLTFGTVDFSYIKAE